MAREQDATRRGERGSFSVELAVLAPALLVMISFIISVGRVTEGRAMVQGAVRDAARAASRAAPCTSDRPSVTRPTEMMNEMISNSAGATTASSSENEPRSLRPACRAMLSCLPIA